MEENQKKSKSKRGGARAGAGRKPKPKIEVIEESQKFENFEKIDLFLAPILKRFDSLEKSYENQIIENKELIRENASLKTELELIKKNKSWWKFWN